MINNLSPAFNLSGTVYDCIKTQELEFSAGPFAIYNSCVKSPREIPYTISLSPLILLVIVPVNVTKQDTSSVTTYLQISVDELPEAREIDSFATRCLPEKIGVKLSFKTL